MHGSQIAEKEVPSRIRCQSNNKCSLCMLRMGASRPIVVLYRLPKADLALLNGGINAKSLDTKNNSFQGIFDCLVLPYEKIFALCLRKGQLSGPFCRDGFSTFPQASPTKNSDADADIRIFWMYVYREGEREEANRPCVYKGRTRLVCRT